MGQDEANLDLTDYLIQNNLIIEKDETDNEINYEEISKLCSQIR